MTELPHTPDDEIKKKFKWTRENIIMGLIFLAIMTLSVAVLGIMLWDDTFLFRVIRDWFILPLIQIGWWAALVFLILMVLQSLIAPIPSELILLSGGMIFGLVWGSILGIIGSMLSAWITFYVSNKGGRAILEATGEKIGLINRFILILDLWIERWGIWAIIVGRAVPLIMFDPISYASGISNVKWKQYSIATFIGSIPRAIFFSILGVQMRGGKPVEMLAFLTQEEVDTVSGQFNTIFYTIFIVLVLMLAIANLVSYLHEKKKKKDTN